MVVQSSEEGPPLIPDLPDDLAVQCLLRIERTDHKKVRRVCKRWNEFVESASYYSLRRQNKTVGGWIYVLARESSERLSWHALDPKAKQWHSVARMPNEVVRLYGVSYESCDGMLYAMGGVGLSKPPRSEVFRYNPITNKWTRAEPMENGRCYAMSGVLNDQILIAGGLGTSTSGSLTSVEVYHPQENRWSSAEDLLDDGDLQDAVVWNKKLHVSHIRCVHTAPRPYVQAYNFELKKWEYEKGEMANGWHGSSVEVDGRLFMVEHVGGIKLMEFDTKRNVWNPIGRLSPSLLSPPCKLVSLDKKLYVIGRGCTVVEVDVEVSSKLHNLLVTRRIDGIGRPSDVVLSCNVLYI